MRAATGEIELRMRRLEQGLRQAGVKWTHQRMVICRQIAGADDHPDAETIFKAAREKVPTISLDTVYRTLSTLLDLGLIDTLGVPRERTRFDGNATPHHHFVCTKCGEARDFYCGEFDHLQVPHEVKAFGSVEKTQVEVKGICRRCSEAAGPRRRAPGTEDRS